MSGNKIKRKSIMVKVGMYEVCVYPFFIQCLPYYITTIIKTIYFTARFLAYLTPGARRSGSIGHKHSSQKRTLNMMNDEG